jgi:hypothetical protein
MLPIKSAPEIHLSNLTNAVSPTGRLFLGSCSSPKSPKMQELLSRNKTLHAINNDPKPSEFIDSFD